MKRGVGFILLLTLLGLFLVYLNHKPPWLFPKGGSTTSEIVPIAEEVVSSNAAMDTEKMDSEKEDGLKAYNLPDRITVEQSVSYIYFIFGVALLGFVAFIILWAILYEPSSTQQGFRETKVERAEGYTPTPRRHLSDSRED